MVRIIDLIAVMLTVMLGTIFFPMHAQTNSCQEYVLLGDEASGHGETDSAIYFYNQAIIKDSSCINAYTQRSNLNGKLKRYDEAINDLNHAIKLIDTISEFYLYRGIYYSLKGNNVKGIEDFEAAIRLDSTNAVAIYNLGVIMLNNEHYEQAEKLFNRALLHEMEKSDLPLSSLGIVYSEAKDYDKALFYFNESIRINEDNELPYNEIARIYRKKGDFENAIIFHKKALEKNTLNPFSYYQMGITYLKIKDTTLAINLFNKSLKLDKNHKPTLQQLAKLNTLRGNFDKAIARYNTLIENDTSDIQLYLNRAILYDTLMYYDKSLHDYNKVIKIKNNHYLAKLRRGIVYVKLNMHQEAIADFEHAIKMRVDQYRPYWELALVYAKLGNEKMACINYKEASFYNGKPIEGYDFSFCD